MTKNLPKRVVKNIQKPRSSRGNYEVIKHFEPIKSSNLNHRDLLAEIPKINVDENNDEIRSPKKTCNSNSRKKVIYMPKLINNKSINQGVDNKPQNSVKQEKKHIPKRIIHPVFKSSSSSSVEANFEKFTNKARVKSKSFHSGQNKKIILSQKTPEVVREKSWSLSRKPNSSLTEKDMNVKALRQEILDNKKNIAEETQRPVIDKFRESEPHILTLKDEISKAKNQDVLHKKILITELKTEIAEYKKFSCFQIYNSSHSRGSPHCDSGQKGHNPLPKSPKRTSLCDGQLSENINKNVAKSCCEGLDVRLNKGGSVSADFINRTLKVLPDDSQNNIEAPGADTDKETSTAVTEDG